MKYLSRVVWSEGMYLGPHHFQAQSRYFEDSIGFTTAALWFEPWGLVGAQLDAEALKNGTVSLIHARGIFEDGMVFHMPECDPLPEPRNIADLFPAVRDTVTIMLAVAPRRPEGANTMTPEAGQNGALRFRAEIQMLHDETTGRDEKPEDAQRRDQRGHDRQHVLVMSAPHQCGGNKTNCKRHCLVERQEPASLGGRIAVIGEKQPAPSR